MKHKIDVQTIVVRLDFLKKITNNKKVLHLGAAQGTDIDPTLLHERINFQKEFLHAILMKNSTEVLGLDYNQQAIENLRKYGINNIMYCDVTDHDEFKRSCGNFHPDIIIVGELIEHLSNPGLMLANIVNNFPGAEVVISTPNLLSVIYPMQAFNQYESHDVDHVIVFTPRLLEALTVRSGIAKIKIRFYETQIYKNKFFNVLRTLFLKLFPQLSDGIIFYGIVKNKE